MRVGMVGLASLYWPECIGNGLLANKNVEFVGAATLGVSDAGIKEVLGMFPAEYAQKFNLKLYNQADEMVKKESLDAVVIATPHTEHAIWAERMARLGMNIFIPKTFATTIEDADRIVEAGRCNGVKIAVGPSARFLPHMMAIKQAIDSDFIGKPFSIRICHHHGTIDCFNKNDWYRDPKEGGPELSLGWYGIDLALQFMGSEVTAVSAEYSNYTTPDSPFMDCGRIDMRMENGGMAAFDMYFCNRVAYPSWQAEIVGNKGVISIHRTNSSPYKSVVSLDCSEGYKELPIPEFTPDWENFWIEDFLENRTPALTSEYARQVTRISLAARESAVKGCKVSL
jgi:predicted dehydrogenase